MRIGPARFGDGGAHPLLARRRGAVGTRDCGRFVCSGGRAWFGARNRAKDSIHRLAGDYCADAGGLVATRRASVGVNGDGASRGDASHRRMARGGRGAPKRGCRRLRRGNVCNTLQLAICSPLLGAGGGGGSL